MTLALLLYVTAAVLAVGFFWALCRAAGHEAYSARDARANAPLSHIRQLVLAPELGDRPQR